MCPYCKSKKISCHLGWCECLSCGKEWSEESDDEATGSRSCAAVSPAVGANESAHWVAVGGAEAGGSAGLEKGG